MSLSLFEIALPSQNCEAGKILWNKTKLPNKGNLKWIQDNYKQNYYLAHILLEICQETADALKNGHYREYDALVKNFGCQMTALEVHQLIKQPHIKEEAERVHQIATAQLEQLRQQKSSLPEGTHGMSFLSYAHDRLNLEVNLSSQMAQLVRFKILNIINSNDLVNGRERPITDINPLNKRLEILNLTDQDKRFMSKNFSFKTWVEGLQEEESKHAAEFIRHAADQIVDPDRGPILRKMLAPDFAKLVRASPKILSVPQMHCGEVAVRAMDDGYIMVKNKLYNCDVPRKDAQPIKIVIKMPEERILSNDEMAQLSQDTPVMVLDTLMEPDCNIANTITDLGVAKFLNATLSQLDQYVGQSAPGPEIEADIAPYKLLKETYKQAEVEHMYTSSLKDEL